MRRMRYLGWISVSIQIVLFSIIILHMKLWESFLGFIFGREEDIIYPRAPLSILVGEHLFLVIVSTLLALIAGTLLGIYVTRPRGRDFLTIVNDVTAIGQTFPPVAVLALAVPIVGFGAKPTILALFLYSILPILRNTVTGLENIPPDIRESAIGMGFTGLQRLLRVELPIALPVIMAGIRISFVINIGTATIGAVVGAGGLGTPIISGLVRNNPSFVLEGALVSAFLAIIADQFLAQIERAMRAPYERALSS